MSKTTKILIGVGVGLILLYLVATQTGFGQNAAKGITSVFGIKPYSLGAGGTYATNSRPTATAAAIVTTAPPKPTPSTTNQWDFASAAAVAAGKYLTSIHTETTG